jgi:hypothetical protein
VGGAIERLAGGLDGAAGIGQGEADAGEGAGGSGPVAKGRIFHMVVCRLLGFGQGCSGERVGLDQVPESECQFAGVNDTGRCVGSFSQDRFDVGNVWRVALSAGWF